MATDFARIQSRGGNEVDLLTQNQTPLDREIIVASDTGKLWIGDGSTPLQNLTPIGTVDLSGVPTINDAAPSQSSVFSSQHVTDLISAIPSTGSGSGGSGASINDQTTTTGTTWSSSKISGVVGAIQAASGAAATMPPRMRARLATRASSFRMVFVGSSTTAGTAATTNANRWVNRFTTGLQAEYPSGTGTEQAVVGLQTGAASVGNAAGIYGYNGGVGGTTSSNFLTSAIVGYINTLQPDVVFVMVGANDIRGGVTAAAYQTNMQTAYNSIKSAITKTTTIILVQTYMPYDATYDPAVWSAYGSALKSIAAADPGNAVYLDLSPAYAAVGIPSTDPLGLMASDKIHQVDTGHYFMADLIASMLDLQLAPTPPVAIVASTGDTTVPTTPGTPTATGGAGSIGLSWAASTDNVAVTGYRIYRSDSTTALGTSTTNSFTDPSPAAGTAYTYRVAAYDAAGNMSAQSAASNSATATAPPAGSDTTAPTAPTNFLASPGNTQAVLTWTAATDNVAVTGYKVYRNGVATATLGNVVTYTDTGLTNGNVYSYQVSALDAAGNESTLSGLSRIMPGSIFDGFQRADAANLGTAPSGQAYAYPANSGKSMVISSNAARQAQPYTANTTDTTTKAQNIVPAPAADFIAAFRVKAAPSSSANGSGGFQFRTAADGSAYCYVSFRQSSSALGASLVKVTSAGATTGGPSVITAGTTVLAAGDLVKLVVSGTTASVYVNGSATAAVTGTIPSNTNLYLGPYTSGAFDGAIDMLSVV